MAVDPEQHDQQRRLHRLHSTDTGTLAHGMPT